MIGPMPRHRAHDRGIYSGQPLLRRDGRVREREEVANFADLEPDEPAGGLQHQDGAFVALTARPMKEFVRIQHCQQRTAHIHQPGDRGRHAWNPGGLYPGQDLPHNPCRGSAKEVADPKDDGMQNRGIRHLY